MAKAEKVGAIHRSEEENRPFHKQEVKRRDLPYVGERFCLIETSAGIRRKKRVQNRVEKRVRFRGNGDVF